MITALLLSSLLASSTCPLPVYLKAGKIRCADRPAATAFGKITWIEKRRPVTLPVSQVDMKRTMGIHRKAPRKGGGFTIIGSAVPVTPLTTNRSDSYRDMDSPPLEPDRVISHDQDPVKNSTLTESERTRIQEALHKAVIERDVMLKRYRALALTGMGPSNTLSTAILNREKNIARYKRQLQENR